MSGVAAASSVGVGAAGATGVGVASKPTGASLLPQPSSAGLDPMGVL